MSEQRLFRLAPEALVSTAVFVPGEGWRLKIGMRRQGESWDESEARRFDHLTTEELVQVLEDCTLNLLWAG